MKKIMNKMNFAIIAIMSSVSAFAASAGVGDIDTNSSGLCSLVRQFGKVFEILRTLAFVGAAFYIAGWAWDFISKGKAEMKDVKEKGTGLLVGFLLLVSVSLILTFITSTFGLHTMGCLTDIKNLGK